MTTSRNSFRTVKIPEYLSPVILRLEEPGQKLSREQLEQFCADNPDLRIEMTSEGDMLIMLPVTGKGSNRNFTLTGRFSAWVSTDGTGVGFDSSGGFMLPNGAERSPDVAWLRKERWDALTEQQKDQFLPLCPDFVVELRSRSDRLKPLQNKMAEYIENGAQLGWLIDPIRKKVHIYRPQQPVEILDHPTQLSGEPLLRGFTLSLEGILD
jgi:Uma2 family endonuclease